MNTLFQNMKITLLNVSYSAVDQSWNYDNVVSPYWRLYLITAGQARIFHHNQTFELKPGHMYLIPAFSFSRYTCDSKMEQFYIHFVEEVGEGESIYNNAGFEYEVKANDIDIRLFERLLNINPGRHLDKEDPKDYENHQTLKRFENYNNQLPPNIYIETNAIISLLLSRFVNINFSKPIGQNDNPAKLNEALSFIHKNLSKPITVKLLADKCYMNADYFSRLFYERMKVRPLQYIQDRRIERAKLLLSSTGHSIKQISHLIGFENPTYFTRLFRKATNHSPVAFRKLHLPMSKLKPLSAGLFFVASADLYRSIPIEGTVI